MIKPTIRIHDLATDQVIDREMTDAEYAEFQAEKAKQVAADEQAKQMAAQKVALLERLGLTEDELKTILS